MHILFIYFRHPRWIRTFEICKISNLAVMFPLFSFFGGVPNLVARYLTTDNLSYIFIKRKLKPTTVNTKASNLTQRGVKGRSDEGNLCLHFTPYYTSLKFFRSSFICAGYLGFFFFQGHRSLRDHDFFSPYSQRK